MIRSRASIRSCNAGRPKGASSLSVPKSPAACRPRVRPAEVAEGKGGRLVLAGEARVIDKSGEDVTEPFVRGAKQAREIALARQMRIAILKEGSPSCGSSYSYDGTFSHQRLPLPGVTTAALEEAGVRVFSENQFDEAEEFLETLDQ